MGSISFLHCHLMHLQIFLPPSQSEFATPDCSALLSNPALGTLGSKMLQQQMENCKYKLQKNKVKFHLQNEEQDPENVCVKSSRMSTHLSHSTCIEMDTQPSTLLYVILYSRF